VRHKIILEELVADFQRWADAEDPVLAWALFQLNGYEHKVKRFRRLYIASELLLLASASATTLVAALSAPAALTASLASVAVFLTGVRQTFDPHERYILNAAAAQEIRMALWQYNFDGRDKDRLYERVREAWGGEYETWLKSQRSLRKTRLDTIETRVRNNNAAELP
jgi:hypothetical protein